MTFRFLLSLLPVFLLMGCASEFTKEDSKTQNKEERPQKGYGKFFGEDTLSFGGAKKREQEDTGLGVNSYLWRASLDTISFMPIASADPFGGVIITDWYSPPQSPQERLKITVFILDRQLRSDGIKVSMFRQEQDSSGHWRDQTSDPQTIKDLENAILKRARDFRAKKVK